MDLSGKMDRVPRTYHEIIAELEAEIELLKSQQYDDRQLILLLGLLLLAPTVHDAPLTRCREHPRNAGTGSGKPASHARMSADRKVTLGRRA